MNPISADIPQLLKSLSDAPVLTPDRPFEISNSSSTSSAKSKNLPNKTKNTQKNSVKNKNPNNSRQSSSKSQKIDLIEEKFHVFEDIIRNNKNHLASTSDQQQQDNLIKNKNTRTVYNQTKDNNFHGNNPKKFNANGQSNDKKDTISSKNGNNLSTNQKNHKMKISASQPSILSYGQEQKAKNNNQSNFYLKYWTETEVTKELEAKKILQGKIRINQRNYEDAFITDSVIIFQIDLKLNFYLMNFLFF